MKTETKTHATMAQAAVAAKALRGWLPSMQLSVLGSNCRGEVGEDFRDMMVELVAKLEAMPKTYEQDGKAEAAVAHLHYFSGGCDWYITEKDMGCAGDAPEDFQIQAFGLADFGYGPELGYISIAELIQNNVEMDLYWTPKTVAECRKEVA